LYLFDFSGFFVSFRLYRTDQAQHLAAKHWRICFSLELACSRRLMTLGRVEISSNNAATAISVSASIDMFQASDS
jgi:hypothetical protein